MHLPLAVVFEPCILVFECKLHWALIQPNISFIAGVRYQFVISRIVQLIGRKEGCSHLRPSLCSQPSALFFASLLPLSVDLSLEHRDQAWTQNSSLRNHQFSTFGLKLQLCISTLWAKDKIHIWVKMLFYYIIWASCLYVHVGLVASDLLLFFLRVHPTEYNSVDKQTIYVDLWLTFVSGCETKSESSLTKVWYEWDVITGLIWNWACPGS